MSIVSGASPGEGQRVVTYDESGSWGTRKITQYEGSSNGSSWEELLRAGTHETVTYTVEPYFGPTKQVTELRKKSSISTDCDPGSCCVIVTICLICCGLLKG